MGHSSMFRECYSLILKFSWQLGLSPKWLVSMVLWDSTLVSLTPSVNAPLGPLYLPTNEGGFLLQDKAPFIFFIAG